MHLLQVDMGELRVSEDPDSVLITYALGSCIAVTVHDPRRQVGGMIHFMLPLSRTSPDKARERPGMFADTGIPLLFTTMYGLGCQKKDLVVKAIGGGKLFEDHGVFDIGRRNYTVLRQLFWKNNIFISGEEVGGCCSRTALLDVGSGRVTIKSQGEERPL